ncbi:unnamed protein product [Peniophora sp. CBMAI 1063]|nr:unnamed protein product [Peniophora sp. CBMAI 1063]
MTVHRPLQNAKRARGRPPNAGPLQTQIIVDNVGEYRSLKARRAPQSDISVAVNKMSRQLIQQFGWDSPLRASGVVERGEHDDSTPEEGQQKRKDETLKKVRKEVMKIWRKTLTIEAEPSIQGSPQLIDLIKTFASKPRRRQDYKIWAKSKPRPALEKEVDSRHAAALESIEPGSTPPPRVSIWNTVASEWYKLAGPKDKKVTRKQARRIHRRAMKEWEASASTMPQSPEEAIRFMERSQTFLGDLMHFFANRISGIAIVFLSGPEGSSLISEGVCNIADMPKVMHTEANPWGTKRFQHDLATQAQTLNNAKWGVTSASNLSGAGDWVENGGEDQYEARGGQIEAFQVGDGVRELETEKELSGGEEEDRDDNGDEAESSEDLSADEAADVDAVRGVEFVLPSRPLHEDAIPSRPVRAPASEQTTSQALVLSGRESQDSTVVHSANLAVEMQPGRLAAMSSAFGSQYHRREQTAEDLNESPVEYNRAFRALIAKILPRKVWLEESNTVNFLKAVPPKLSGRVSTSSACKLSLAYLSYEQSKAEELALVMKTMGASAVPTPVYTNTLYQRGFTSRWNGRADSVETRTPAKLDADVNVTLPRQWALLQPAERLDMQGCICVAPNVDMDWRNVLAPGLEGIRLLVVTTLVWAYNIKDDELTEWSSLATDMIQVLGVLLEQECLRAATSATANLSDEDDGLRPKKSARTWKKSAKLREMESRSVS